MSNRRSISWSAAVLDMKADRFVRAEVREERLRTAVGLGAAGTPLTAWRGRSAKRYVFAIQPLEAAGIELEDRAPCVVVAVRRPDADPSEIVQARVLQPGDEGLEAWLSGARGGGASELHVHMLARSPSEREEIVRDLEPAF